MNTQDLKISNVEISEYEYDYKGLFTLSSESDSIRVDMSDLDNDKRISEIKNLFGLVETLEEIKKLLTSKVIENSNLDSHITEGEKYQEKNTSDSAKELDMA